MHYSRDKEAKKPNACSIGLFHRNHVLLIQRAYAPFLGLWTFPGGQLEQGETPAECVTRELFEETRLIVTDPLQVLIESMAEGERSYTLAVFAAQHPMTAPVVSHEISDWEWVPIDEVSRYRTTDHLDAVVHACAECLGLAMTE